VATHRTLALREILVAVDFSSHSDQAFEAALALAEHFGSRLHVFHAAADDFEKGIAEVKLNTVSDPAGTVNLVKAVSLGPAAPEILGYADREKIDLIVIGTHGRSGMSRVLRGSVAEEVLRAAPCQVLAIPPKAHPIVEPHQVEAASETTSACLVCAKPSRQTICDPCKAYTRGEAIERKRREEKGGRLAG